MRGVLLAYVLIALVATGGIMLLIARQPSLANRMPLYAPSSIYANGTTFPCSNLPDMYSRVSCRISLKFENELNYLPEECRVLSGFDRDSCISLYARTDPCFANETDAGRFACAASVLGIQNTSLRAQVNRCNGNQTCISLIDPRVSTLTKFYFYNLEYHAQEMYTENGANKTKVVNIIVALEQEKIAFNNAQTVYQKLKLIDDATAKWNSFLAIINSTG